MKTTIPKTLDKVAAPNKEQDLNQKVMQRDSPRAPIISKSDLVATKVLSKATIPFNIVEKMKRTNINVSMWNTLAIPSQRGLPTSGSNKGD